MTRAQIQAMLAGGSWNSASDACRKEFAQQLRGKQYGREELMDAWSWFYVAWIRAAFVLGESMQVAGGPEHTAGCIAIEWVELQLKGIAAK